MVRWRREGSAQESAEKGRSSFELQRRRSSLQAMGVFVASGLLGGCVRDAGQPAKLRYRRPFSRKPFAAPRISEDRIVRVIVGHRPYRPSGFVVRRDDFGETQVIHNYGHGGGGISLAWGLSALALHEAAGLPVGDAAVIGSGIMGLTTARLLQDAYQNLVGADYGVSFVENYYIADEPLCDGYYLRELPELFTSVADLEPGEHPFPTRYAKQTVTLLIEPAMFLRRVRNDFFIAGGRIVAQELQSQDEVLSLDETVVFNCTGLGAKALFNDEELQPAKGQLVFIPPDPAVDYLTVGSGASFTYMFPRRGEILLGGSWQLGDWSTETDPGITERIIADNRALFDNLTL